MPKIAAESSIGAFGFTLGALGVSVQTGPEEDLEVIGCVDLPVGTARWRRHCLRYIGTTLRRVLSTECFIRALQIGPLPHEDGGGPQRLKIPLKIATAVFLGEQLVDPWTRKLEGL